MNKKILAALISITSATIISLGCSLAWFAEITKVDLNNLTGNIYTGYFYSGTGTADDPYTITRPIHYYNMVKLIDYNSEEFGDKFYQIGYDLEENGTLEVYGYDNDGHTTGSYSNTLNMSAYPIIMIGTEDEPFTGQLDGSNITVSNLTVNPQEGVSDVGIFGYVSEDAYIHDIYYNGVSIDTSNLVTGEDGAAHCGYLAGHLEYAKSFDGVYINNCELIGQPSVAYTNDWGYFGHCDNARSLEDFVAKGKGADNGWGGSIGMDELYNRIDTFRQSSVTQQDTIKSGEYHYYNNGVEDLTKSHDIITDLNSYEYYNNDLTGRVVYGQTQENYLWGKRTHSGDFEITNEYHSDDDEIVYYILSSDYYLYLTGGDAKRDRNNKTLLFVDADGYVYYKYNNKNYYLYAESDANGTLKSSTIKQAYMFKVSGTALRLYQVSNDSAKGRYVRYRNSSYQVYSSSTAITQTTDYKVETTKTGTWDYETHGTYLPLNVYKAADAETMAADQDKLANETLIVNGAKLNNSGYIVGGTKDMSDNYGSAVRVAKTYDYGDLYRAFGRSKDGGANDRYSANSLQILTRTKDSDGVTYINDTFNNGTVLTNNQKNLSYVTTANRVKKNVTDLGLKNYSSARTNLDEQFGSTTSTLYVMRFNEFQIDINNTITAEKVLLNGELKTNYVFPESCVDFNLKEKGYISFFGGGFRGGNCNAFFSLYHIIRDEDDNITSLKHLSQVYGTDDSRDPFIYKYDDGTYAIYNKKTKAYESASLTSDYEMHFNLNWVEAPGFTAVDNTCWYFEIPVNEGEYALGAVDGRTGAYMFYLDVGSAGGTESYSTDTFGPIEYRDSPNVVENSILLITYEAAANTEITVSVEFSGTQYNVSITSSSITTFRVTLLSNDFTVVVNNSTTISVIKTEVIMI